MFKYSLGGGWLNFVSRLKAYLPTKMEAQADSTAVDVAGAVADLNALLAKLRASGAMEAEE